VFAELNASDFGLDFRHELVAVDEKVKKLFGQHLHLSLCAHAEQPALLVTALIDTSKPSLSLFDKLVLVNLIKQGE
jgi:deoxycytidylate deaminase